MRTGYFEFPILHAMLRAFGKMHIENLKTNKGSFFVKFQIFKLFEQELTLKFYRM